MTITGTVYTAPDSSLVLKHALVGLYKKDTYIAVRTTDAQGRFSFDVLPTAPYQLRVFLDGYEEYQQDIGPAEASRPLWIGLVDSYSASLAENYSSVDSIITFDPSDYQHSNYVEPEFVDELPAHGPDEEIVTIFDPDSFEETVIVVKKSQSAIAEEPAPLPEEEEAITTTNTVALKAGQLTAGVISDHNDWDTWRKRVFEPLQYHAWYWDLYPLRRYWIQVVNHQRVPLPNCTVQLHQAEGPILWETRTDNTGRAELWYQLDQKNPTIPADLRATVTHNGFSQTLKTIHPYEEGANTITIRTPCRPLTHVDIAWVIDATLSMEDELSYIQDELVDVINRVQAQQADLNLQQAAIFYRDNGSPDYVTRHHAFTPDGYALQKFINQQEAGSGVDDPEAVEEALTLALDTLQWRDDALTRLLFLILDAPPHYSEARVLRLQQLIATAAKKGIKIIPVAASGVEESTEYLLRALALATNGHYTFLTDHSGIGDSHNAPTASVYGVELLNDLLVRLIDQALMPPFCAGQIPADLLEEAPTAAAAAAPLALSPNPAYQVVRVSIPEGIPQILITDANGRLLEQWDALTAGERRWSVRHYPVGVYFLHYVQDGQPRTERLVVGRR